MQVLIVEDDPDIAQLLARGLLKYGLDSHIAASGEEALSRLQDRRFYVMVLDRMLPRLDGMDVLRRKPRELPVVMLSALGTLEDRIEGLDAGADDYLVKPFEIAEVVARLNAVSRRTRAPDRGDVLSAGDLEITLATFRASRRGRRLHLNKKEFALLAELVRNAGRTVTRKMLIEAVWGYSFEPSTNIVESNMSRLRSKLTAHGDPDPIETARGSGYVFRPTYDAS